MSRPLRIQFPFAVYHVTSRGNARADIFVDDQDRCALLDGISALVSRYNWICHAYCLMDNHYHLLIETPDANLAEGMRQLNGNYTQRFNRRHNRVGHIFQGRYKAVVVEKDSHLLELCRYVVLNPVRAGIVAAPEQWRWSSFCATAGARAGEEWLTSDWILSQFGTSRAEARKRYSKFVRDGITSKDTPWMETKGGIVFGSNGLVTNMHDHFLGDKEDVSEIPRVQRLIGRPGLNELFSGSQELKTKRNVAVAEAHLRYGYTLTEIAQYLRMHYTSISKIIKREAAKR